MMSISEKIFNRLTEIKMSQSEFSRQTGISTSTINDWKHKKTNPTAEKLVCICKVLGVSLGWLLGEEYEIENSGISYTTDEGYFIQVFNLFDAATKRRMVEYFEKILLSADENISICNEKRNISVVYGADGEKIVIINDILFKGKRKIEWKEVKEYLKQYTGNVYQIVQTAERIYIGNDLPDEYTGSQYTKTLKGTVAKAKANAATGIPELLEIASGKHFRENKEEKHKRDAKNGWYRYDSCFALPVYDEEGTIERYNVFHASMLIRHANDGKMYLYDILDIKKKQATLSAYESLPEKNPFL